MSERVTAEQLTVLKRRVDHLRVAASCQRMSNGYFNYIGEQLSEAADGIERCVAEVERMRRECAMHVMAARKVHRLAVTLADGDRLSALKALQDDGELHRAIHDCLTGECTQEWIDVQLAVERAQTAYEIERLREAIAWALGESPEGIPEFMPPEGKHPPYWWRKQLRELASPSSLQPPKEGP